MIAGAYSGKYKEAESYALSKGQTHDLDPDVISGIVASGQTAVAVEVLQEAKKKNPSLAAQIDDYIKQLLAPKK